MADKKNIEKKIFSKNEFLAPSEKLDESKFEKTPLKPEKKEVLDNTASKEVEANIPLYTVSDDAAGLAAQTSIASVIKRREEAIDSILADGLNDVFLKMDPKKQQEFKKEGEETTKKIAQLLSETKIRVVKIVELIKKWLKIIPGVNKFFIEQEAKLKADKIIKMKKDL